MRKAVEKARRHESPLDPSNKELEAVHIDCSLRHYYSYRQLQDHSRLKKHCKLLHNYSNSSFSTVSDNWSGQVSTDCNKDSRNGRHFPPHNPNRTSKIRRTDKLAWKVPKKGNAESSSWVLVTVVLAGLMASQGCYWDKKWAQDREVARAGSIV